MKAIKGYRYTTLAGLALALTTGTAMADVYSSFDNGREGWSAVSFTDLVKNLYTIKQAWTPDWNGSGGNPGGFIAMTDPDGGVTAFSAPASFLGAQTSMNSLSYDIKQLVGTPNYQTTDVILVGANGTRLIWKSQPDIVPSLNTWTTVRVQLAPSANWTVSTTDGSLATAADFNGVMSQLSHLYIRSEYVNGADTEGIDNVRLSAAVVPEPEAWALLLAGSLALLMTTRRRCG